MRLRTLALLVLLPACGTTHLGVDYGKANRAAYDAQASKRGQAPAPLDAADAATVMARHQGKGAGPLPGSGQGAIQVPMGTAPPVLEVR